MLAQNAELLDWQDDRFELLVSDAHRAVATRDFQDKLREALSQHFDRPVQLIVTLGEASGDTPAAQLLREKEQRQGEAEAEIQNDPFVQTLVRDFDATVLPDSIKPL